MDFTLFTNPHSNFLPAFACYCVKSVLIVGKSLGYTVASLIKVGRYALRVLFRSLASRDGDRATQLLSEPQSPKSLSIFSKKLDVDANCLKRIY